MVHLLRVYKPALDSAVPDFFDSHAHLTGSAVFPHLEAYLERAKLVGVNRIVNICTDEESLHKGLAVCEQFPWIALTASTTPHNVDQEGESFFPLVKKAALEKKLAAIGETGLDYFYSHSERENQKRFLVRYLHLALETNLPVVIHCREAFSDFFDMIDQEYPSSKGVLHCFTGTMEEAEEVLKRGWMLSLSGIVTFKKSTTLQEVAKNIPLNQLLIETDTPYLAPQSQRGKPNEPAFLVETAKCVAKLRNMSTRDLARATHKNASHFFNLS